MKTRMIAMCLFIVCFIFPCQAEEFRFPLDSQWEVIQDFGVWNSTAGGYHLAEDAVATIGTTVFACADGLVKFADTATGYSGLVIIEHKEACSLYGHLGKASLRVSAGQLVNRGTLLGYVASPAEYSNDPNMPSHIHFGIRKEVYTTQRYCEYWAYVGYSQQCSGITHEQYLEMWVDPTNYIGSHLPPSQTFKAGDRVKILPDVGLRLRNAPKITADDSSKIALMRKDEVITILDHTENGIAADGYYWWYAQYGDNKGWCAEADYQRISIYLSLTSEPATIPGPAAKIKVEEADIVWEAPLVSSERLVAASRGVSPRIIMDYADSAFSGDLTGTMELTRAARGVLPRIIVEYADSASSKALERFYMGGVMPERTMSITSAEASPGTSAIIFLSISDATGVAGGDILIRYNADLLTIGQVRGTDLLSGISPVVNRDVPGEIRIGMAGTQGLSSGSGAIVEIEITVNADAQPGIETSLILDSVEVYDESGAAIPVNSENGIFRIIEPVGIKGDVNGDDQVRSNDAILTLRIATGLVTPTDEQKWAADMNGDGKVKSNDAILILRRAAGLAAPGRAPMAGASKQITVMLAEAHGVAGEMVAVPLRLDITDGIAGGDICATYDSTTLRAVDVSFDCGALMESNMAEPGMVHIAFACLDGLQSKTLAEIRFEVLADDVSLLILEHVEFYRSDALPIDTIKVDGKFRSWAVAPERSALFQNYPNPFNPDTWIPYKLKEGSEVTVEIFSLPGNLIRKLNLGYKPAGVYVSQDRAAYWDGRNASGERVASGICFYTIRAGDFAATRKMTITQ